MSASIESPEMARVVAREYDAANDSVYSALYVEAAPEETIRVGRTVALSSRAGVLEIGADPEDRGVSREALTLTARPDGWQITVLNQRGAMLHPWGMSGAWLEPGSTVHRRWPRIALRVIGAVQTPEHWVLLEHEGYRTAAGAAPHDSLVTDTTVERPEPLSDKMEAAIRAVFAQHLDWPCRSHPQAAKLKTAARMLGISGTGVSERLEPVKQRAYQLGLHEQFGVTGPDYVETLVAHGYLDPPMEFVTAELFS